MAGFDPFLAKITLTGHSAPLVRKYWFFNFPGIVFNAKNPFNRYYRSPIRNIMMRSQFSYFSPKKALFCHLYVKQTNLNENDNKNYDYWAVSVIFCLFWAWIKLIYNSNETSLKCNGSLNTINLLKLRINVKGLRKVIRQK